MLALRFDENGATDIDRVGGKGASLGELARRDFPVPDGFVVTADAYREFLERTGIADELGDVLDVEADDEAALSDAAERARELIRETVTPEEIETAIRESFADLDADGPVAVRSSATAEDLPDASFAGQQETFLNVTGDDLLDRVKECWVSLFTERAVHYRARQGFDHERVNIAVVVQEMVDAEKSGVLFTHHPSTGEERPLIEAAWGLGEGVVSGSVTPDKYEVGDGEPIDAVVAEKETMVVRDPDTGETVEQAVPEGKQTARVLDEEEIESLVELGREIETHYGQPQDVEWAIADGEIYLLQSRPITTIDAGTETNEGTVESDDPTVENDAATGERVGTTDGGTATMDDGDAEEFERIDGIGASPGVATGQVRVVTTLDELDEVGEGDVIVTPMTTPDMVPAMQRASAIVTNEGGMTSHAAIVSRELGVPAVVGTKHGTDDLDDGETVRVDGDRGVVEPGEDPTTSEETANGPETERTATGDVTNGSGTERSTTREESSGPPTTEADLDPITGTKVFVNVSVPEAAERAAATGADGVGLLRMEHMVLSLGKTPARYIADHGESAFVDELVEGIRQVADAFYPDPVRVRTLDAPTDEFRELEGGEDEPEEPNPMLGYRGIRRSLDEPEVFERELRAFARLHEMGYSNVEVMFPLVNDAEDVHRARAHMEAVGMDPEKRRWGVMVETPASALCIDEIARTGIDFVSFGTNDLTQYTLAVDRNNGEVADRYDELHPAVLQLITETIETCREHGVETSICGEAGSRSPMVERLVDAGITSISANIDAVSDVRATVKRFEQRLMLDAIRDGRR